MLREALADVDVENVLLVSVDCLRADAFLDGVDDGLVPTMAGLKESGVYYEDAFTVANTTDPSLTSVMTAQYPGTHGVRENGLGVGDETPLLAERLRDGGYRTFGVVSVDHLSDEHSGLGRGFDAYRIDDSYDTLYPILSRIFDTKTFNLVFGAVKNLGTERYNVKNLLRDVGLIRLHCRSARSVNEDAVEELDRTDGPFFGWLHYFDMHEPRNFSRDLLDDHDEYTASMITVDDYLGDVLDELERRGLRDETLVVLTADHGENLGDHGYTGHGRTLYDEEVHVPLLFSHPDLSATSVDGQVRTVDLAPTILDLLDVPAPDSFQGESVADGTGDRDVFMNAYPEFTDSVGVRSDGWKLIREGETYELYDLDADPDERTDLRDGDEHAETFEALRERLSAWEREQDGTGAVDREVDESTQEMLEDLGYVD